MRTVELIMSQEREDCLSTLLMDGKTCRDTRLNGWMIGQPMNNWVPESVTRYAVWRGLPQELSSVLNAHTFTICFCGSSSAYTRFTDILSSVESPELNITLEFRPDECIYDFPQLKNWIDSFIPITRDKNIRRQFSMISQTLGDSCQNVYMNVLYEENEGSKIISYMPFPFIHFCRTGFIETSIPSVVTAGGELSADLEEISLLHDIPLQDIVVLSPRVSGNDALSQQVRRLWPAVKVFVLSGTPSEDSQTLSRLSSHYRKFFVRRLREFVAGCPRDAWLDIDALNALLKSDVIAREAENA